MGSDTKPLKQRIGSYMAYRMIDTSPEQSTYEAEHLDTHNIVYLRVLSVGGEDVEIKIDECLDELGRVSQINAPNILPLVDYGHEGRVLYMATPIMPGGTLEQRLIYVREMGMDLPQHPSLGELADFVDRIADALQALHDIDTIHGQIEPRSIMFDDEGQAYVADIGLMRLTKILFRLDTTNSLTMSKYTAPEMWEGDRPVPATDQYALACIVYELLTGRPPFRAPSIFGLMNMHMNDVAPSPHQLRPDLPMDLAVAFWQALAKPPDSRYHRVSAFARAFRTAIAGREGDPNDFFRHPIEYL